ncbi:hypothetical protein [Nitrospirillum iridis]|uniref:Spy/CpxP family protein refolding chaperone n=1 Tax=Nitrospirillum iridis TaxID=765888 RepID=A0A7X0ECZ5_9PROT|nr:hypothetical protein [Nitrospirillum iridis]MBB6250486.1 Spy/CpxP family protein refolding chaperone [Nitrospirillum iridis]
MVTIGIAAFLGLSLLAALSIAAVKPAEASSHHGHGGHDHGHGGHGH